MTVIPSPLLDSPGFQRFPPSQEEWDAMLRNLAELVPEYQYHWRQTTAAAVAFVMSVPMVANSAVLIHYRVIGKQPATVNVAAFEGLELYYDNGAGPVADAASPTVISAMNTPAWGGFSTAVAGQNVNLRVQGLAATTVNWRLQVRVLEVRD